MAADPVISAAHRCIESVICVFQRCVALTSFISKGDAFLLVARASEHFRAEPAVLTLSGDFTVVGDLHGSLFSMLRIFAKMGYPPGERFLFLGDYVDRGEYSSEVILMLFALKVLYPDRIFMLRGNHECRSLTGLYGFRKDCEAALGRQVYEAVSDSFLWLPIAAVLKRTIFCVHGGFSPAFKSRADIFKIVKPGDDPVAGPESDLLWSDFEAYVDDFEENLMRGSGYIYGPKDTGDFLRRCQFDTIIRSHQAADDGIRWDFGPDGGCLTVFSAIDYMGLVNDGGIAIVAEDGSISTAVFHPLIGAMKRRWTVVLPEFLLDQLPVRPPPLKRTLSQPMAIDSGRLPGMEIRIE
jgi:diadenosine tetraphosphatase ApaH/serine/threonine PP2A family protein phosphatase